MFCYSYNRDEDSMAVSYCTDRWYGGSIKLSRCCYGNWKVFPFFVPYFLSSAALFFFFFAFSRFLISQKTCNSNTSLPEIKSGKLL